MRLGHVGGLGNHLILLLAVGCHSWELTRQETIIPINALLHQDYPEALKEMDVEKAARLFEIASQEKAREELNELLSRFRRVVHARCVIESVRADGEKCVAVSARLRLEGTDASSQRCALSEKRRFICNRHAQGWSIQTQELLESSYTIAQGPSFADEAALRGLNYTHSSRGLRDRWGDVQDYLAGSGLAVRDIDGNGYEDVLLVSGDELRLFLNHTGFFVDVTEAYGLLTPEEGECRLGVFGDIDNDGDGDLFVGVVDGSNYLFRFEAGQYRALVADTVGIASSWETTGACFADFDNDGYLDLYVANGGNLLREHPEPIYNAKNGTANQLFLNRGDGTFSDVTASAGVGDTGWALVPVATDFDQDGDQDLFVANDFGFDVLYENLGNGTFREITQSAGVTYRGSSMGASFGDVDADGDIDLFVSGMAANARWIIDQPGFPSPAPWPISVLFRDHVLNIMKEMMHGNRFYVNRGDGSFDEISSVSGTQYSDWAWGGIFFDYDNDGLLDIYVVNGFRSGQERKDL